MTRDPELRFTQSGQARATFGIAWNQRGRDGQEDRAHFFNVVAWGSLAENCAESLRRGDRVIVHGRWDWRKYTTQDGDERQVTELVLESCGPDLNWARAQVEKNERSGNGGTSHANHQQFAAANQGGGYQGEQARYSDEEPFALRDDAALDWGITGLDEHRPW